MKTTKIFSLSLICLVCFGCNSNKLEGGGNNAETETSRDAEAMSIDAKVDAALKLAPYLKFDEETKTASIEISQEKAESQLGISKEMYEYHMKDLQETNQLIQETLAAGEEINFDEIIKVTSNRKQ